jgi:small subunit ribosomal protein S16
MLAIKLQRIGKKHQPSYRIVVAERRSKMAAPPVEDLGSYNPFTKEFTLDRERVAHWMKMGAKPTVTMHNFLVSKKAISGKKMAVKMKKAVLAPTTPSAQPSASQTEKPMETVVSTGSPLDAKTGEAAAQ